MVRIMTWLDGQDQADRQIICGVESVPSVIKTLWEHMADRRIDGFSFGPVQRNRPPWGHVMQVADVGQPLKVYIVLSDGESFSAAPVHSGRMLAQIVYLVSIVHSQGAPPPSPDSGLN